MGSNHELINPFHNQYVLRLISVLNALDASKKYSKKEIVESINSKITYMGYDSSSLIDEAVSAGILTSADEEKGLYKKASGKRIHLPMSFSEKIYLKNILNSPYAALFLDAPAIEHLLSQLEDVPDICFSEIMEYKMTAPDPNFSKENIADFRLLLQAIHEKRMIQFKNRAHDGKIYENRSIPVKIEFSVIRRHFWLSLWNPFQKRPFKADFSRISEIQLSDTLSDEQYNETIRMMEMRKEINPIILEITDRKQAIERAGLLFSIYDRTIDYIDEKTIRMSIKYYSFDRDEIIEGIMSLGPAARVILPQNVVDIIKEKLSAT